MRGKSEDGVHAESGIGPYHLSGGVKRREREQARIGWEEPRAPAAGWTEAGGGRYLHDPGRPGPSGQGEPCEVRRTQGRLWRRARAYPLTPALVPDSASSHPRFRAYGTAQTRIGDEYKQKKEVEHRLSALKSAVESGQADDECVREYYLLHLRRWIGIILEEIKSIDQEIKILRGKDSSKEPSTSHSSRRDRPPMKPFVLTRNMAQTKIFGAGYPSLASMMVNDWYKQHWKFGALPDQGIAKKTSEELRTAAQRQDQEQEEEDDEQAVHRAWEWDDWKDTHPRGYGNRQNMG
ncbi:immunoglobulin-binding protein 1-like [Mesoplodon densirostris]|uniref:immunoglobulin-binding protein 1-like n=1 Tax=Mesoplodon densirostris TaxID=48708 RepID=UPI0028DBECFB|nr:immunoglobulin-binding protein 1-like [Mesoplodon densirostris]